MNSGNNFDVVVQRGNQIWKPTVTPLPEPKMIPGYGPVATKTSLAHNQKLAPSTYNSPIKLYSDDSIAQTLAAHAEVLDKDKGVIGVNFMKNEKAYDGHTSDVLRMVQEMDSEPAREMSRTPTDLMGHQDLDVVQSHSFKLLQRTLGEDDDLSSDSGLTPITRSVQAPQTNPASEGGSGHAQGATSCCSECERPIVGVFVRVKNKNLHAECFKCSTCGSSLKNVGYYNINNKLYCDIHAKQAARSNPPAPNMEPITVAPGHARPVGSFTSMQAMNKNSFSGFQQTNGPSPTPSFGPVPYSPIAHSPVSAPLQNFSSPAPAPFKAPACSASGPSPFSIAPKPSPMPSFSSSANPQGFGAPAGNAIIRSHIPKKGDVSTNFASPAVGPGISSNAMPKPAPPPFSGIGDGGMNTKGVRQVPGQRSAPRRGRGTMNQASASRIPMCAACQRQIRGPFVSALGKTWCPDHFVCATSTCKQHILEMGFVEEKGSLYCEVCYEQYLAPICGKCDKRIKGDCLNAVGKQFHPDCFCCAYCGKIFGAGAFYLEDGLPYCETDWNDLFTTKCVGCNFPIEAGDRWVEALNNNYHSQCFKCSKCHKNLEGQSFFAKGGKPFCKAHAQRAF